MVMTKRPWRKILGSSHFSKSDKMVNFLWKRIGCFKVYKQCRHRIQHCMVFINTVNFKQCNSWRKLHDRSSYRFSPIDMLKIQKQLIPGMVSGILWKMYIFLAITYLGKKIVLYFVAARIQTKYPFLSVTRSLLKLFNIHW